MARAGRAAARKGFTLIELLVVLFIVLLVSAVALPTVYSALQGREMSEAARILQGAIIGARDRAIHQGQPSGIRLLPDPSFPVDLAGGGVNPYGILAYNRIVPIDVAPQYYEGYCTPTVANTVTYQGATLSTPAAITAQYSSALLLIESPVNPQTPTIPNPPTSWFWNIRVGDKIQLNNAGAWYTVVGPMTIGPAPVTIGTNTYANPDLFVNVGPPDSLANQSGKSLVPTLTYPNQSSMPVEFLVLVNGQDDNANGWIDEGFDGVDNNSNGEVDEHLPGQTTTSKWSFGGQNFTDTVIRDEWEVEAWLGNVLINAPPQMPYTIQRRAFVAPGAREIALPTNVVIDATTLLTTRERSRLPINAQTRYTGAVDIMLNPDGTVLTTSDYGTPSSFGMDQAFYHLWLADRRDVQAVAVDATSGSPTPIQAAGTAGDAYYLPIARPGGTAAASFAGPFLQGQYSLVSLNGRTGQVTTSMEPPFFYDTGAGWTNQPTSTGAVHRVAAPFTPSQQGLTTGP